MNKILTILLVLVLAFDLQAGSITVYFHNTCSTPREYPYTEIYQYNTDKDGGTWEFVEEGGITVPGNTTVPVSQTSSYYIGGYYFGATESDGHAGSSTSDGTTINMDCSSGIASTDYGTTNVTIALTNNLSNAYGDLIWTLNGSIHKEDDHQCPGVSDSDTATLKLNSDGSVADSFYGYLSNLGSDVTNFSLTADNPSGSGSVMGYTATVNGSTVATGALCPGEHVAVPVSGNMCAGYSASMATSTLGPSSTNVTGTVNNDTKDKLVTAFWKMNNSMIKSEILQPGQSDSDTASVSLCGSQNFTWGYTVSGTIDNPLGNTNIVGGSFTNSQTGGVNGQGAAGGDNGADTLYKDTTFTNNVNYPEGTNSGLALDSTVRAGFGTLHNDNLTILKGMGTLSDKLDVSQSTLAGMSNGIGLMVTYAGQFSNDVFVTGVMITNAIGHLSPATNQDYSGTLTQIATNTSPMIDLNAKFGAFTNELGQVVSYMAVLTNDAWLITQELTNQGNLNPSNVLTVTFGTNAPFALTATNVMSLTNYATETTLEGISNLLAGGTFTNLTDFDTNIFAAPLYTNDLGQISVDTSGILTNLADIQAASDAAAASSGVTTQEDKFMSVITDWTGDLPDYFPAVDMTIDLTAYSGGAVAHLFKAKSITGGGSGFIIDCDPLHTDWGVQLFDLCRHLCEFLMCLSFLGKIIDDAWRVVGIMVNAHSINAKQISVLMKSDVAPIK